MAEFMKGKGVTKLYVLNDKEAYGLGVATTTRKAAEHLGIEVVGFEAGIRRPRATSRCSRRSSRAGRTQSSSAA